uniref:G_PROTEIN_RECEP_F2_3 domain-containing protein n=1 Tax=Steinernema glaseri TaxID=37863 RepID=A0A1I8AF92_9BILA
MIKLIILSVSLCFFAPTVLSEDLCVATWASWTEWSLCSGPEDMRFRWRMCTTKGPNCLPLMDRLCGGQETEEESRRCEEAHIHKREVTSAPAICSTVGEWTEWTQWTLCAPSGVQRRDRYCQFVPVGCKMGQGFMCNETENSYHDSRSCGGSSDLPPLTSLGYLTSTTAMTSPKGGGQSFATSSPLQTATPPDFEVSTTGGVVEGKSTSIPPVTHDFGSLNSEFLHVIFHRVSSFTSYYNHSCSGNNYYRKSAYNDNDSSGIIYGLRYGHSDRSFCLLLVKESLNGPTGHRGRSARRHVETVASGSDTEHAKN